MGIIMEGIKIELKGSSEVAEEVKHKTDIVKKAEEML
jgi:hypothetical protein